MTAVQSAATAAADAIITAAAVVRGCDDPAGLDAMGIAATEVAEATEYFLRACSEFLAGCPNMADRAKRDFEDAAGYAGILADHLDSRLNHPLVMGGSTGRQGWLGRRRYGRRDR